MVSKLNKKESELEMISDLRVRPKYIVDKVNMDVDTGLSTPTNIFVGQALNQDQVLFSIGPHNPSPLCEAKMSKLKSPVRKKNKKRSNVLGNENAWKEDCGINKRNKEATEKVVKPIDNEMGLK